MSGRGSGKGRGGRGGGRFNYRQKFKKKNERKKKGLTDYNYYIGSNRQASDYENTTEYIINHIKKTYSYGKDIAEALMKLQPADTSEWQPSLQVSVVMGDDDEAVRKRAQEETIRNSVQRRTLEVSIKASPVQ